MKRLIVGQKFQIMNDEYFMQQALEQADLAASFDEVPVGAVVVLDGKIIARAYNRPIGNCDPSAHAEIEALRIAAKVCKNYRLPQCELFVTLEPCAMCVGAIMHARIARLIYGAADAKTGACESVLRLFDEAQLNHHTRVTSGVLKEDCVLRLKQFFANKRKMAKTVASLK